MSQELSSASVRGSRLRPPGKASVRATLSTAGRSEIEPQLGRALPGPLELVGEAAISPAVEALARLHPPGAASG